MEMDSNLESCLFIIYFVHVLPVYVYAACEWERWIDKKLRFLNIQHEN